MRGQLVLKCFRDRPDSVIPKCIVTAHCEDERHAIYETLRRMVHPSGTAGEAGQQRPHAARIVLDTAGSAAPQLRRVRRRPRRVRRPALLRRVRRRRGVRRVWRRRAHGRALRRGLRKRGRWRSIIPPVLLP